MSRRTYLEIINPSGEATFHELDLGRGITTIGRHAKNSIVINHPNVAPFHAVLDHRQKPYEINILSEEEEKPGERLLFPDISTALLNWDMLEVAGHILILFEDEGFASKR